MLIKEVKTMTQSTLMRQEMLNPTEKLAYSIERKRMKNIQLNFAINDLVILKLTYMQKSNELLLITNFKEVTGESRPTVAMKEAWIENELFDEKMELEIAKENVKSIQRDIDLINDDIKLYEYQCQMKLGRRGKTQ